MPGLQGIIDQLSGSGQYLPAAVMALIFASAYVLLNLLADVLSTLSNPRLMHPR